MGASEEVEALLLLVSDLAPVSSSYFLKMLAEKLTQKFYRVVGYLGVIAMKDLNKIFPNKLADPVGMELLEL